MGRLTNDLSEKPKDSLDILIENYERYIKEVEQGIECLVTIKDSLEAQLLKFKIVRENQ